jgi:hypothetical protein
MKTTVGGGDELVVVSAVVAPAAMTTTQLGMVLISREKPETESSEWRNKRRWRWSSRLTRSPDGPRKTSLSKPWLRQEEKMVAKDLLKEAIHKLLTRSGQGLRLWDMTDLVKLGEIIVKANQETIWMTLVEAWALKIKMKTQTKWLSSQASKKWKKIPFKLLKKNLENKINSEEEMRNSKKASALWIQTLKLP